MMENKEELFEAIRKALVTFDVEALKKMVLQAVQREVKAEQIVDVMSEGMEQVGQKYETGEYFVSELIIAGETMKDALEVLEPYMEEETGGKLGTAVVATVAGDLHNIGKNIFVTLMTTAGFKVIDLGVDVSADKIVEAVKEHRPDVLGLSALLTTNLEQFPIIVEKLKTEGVRDAVKIIIGGATITEEYARRAGVDSYAKTAIAGVNICKGWINEVQAS
jgi:methylmalonyl-CoA mutase cobalamin-binding domain/chain